MALASSSHFFGVCLAGLQNFDSLGVFQRVAWSDCGYMSTRLSSRQLWRRLPSLRACRDVERLHWWRQCGSRSPISVQEVKCSWCCLRVMPKQHVPRISWWRQLCCRGGQCRQYRGPQILLGVPCNSGGGLPVPGEYYVDLSASGVAHSTWQQCVPRISSWRQLGCLAVVNAFQDQGQSGPCWMFSAAQALDRSWCRLRVDIRGSLASCTPTGTYCSMWWCMAGLRVPSSA